MTRQAAHSSEVLNDKFASSTKDQVSYNTLSEVYGGLEWLLGAPKMLKGQKPGREAPSLLNAMEKEHSDEKDSVVEFECSNGVTTTSKIEWEIVLEPDLGKLVEAVYPERVGYREAHPEWCRKFVPLAKIWAKASEEVNPKLEKAGHPLIIEEEIVAGRLCTLLWTKCGQGTACKSGVQERRAKAACDSCVLHHTPHETQHWYWFAIRARGRHRPALSQVQRGASQQVRQRHSGRGHEETVQGQQLRHDDPRHQLVRVQALEGDQGHQGMARYQGHQAAQLVLGAERIWCGARPETIGLGTRAALRLQCRSRLVFDLRATSAVRSSTHSRRPRVTSGRLSSTARAATNARRATQ
jgi:hypothetical protein